MHKPDQYRFIVGIRMILNAKLASSKSSWNANSDGTYPEPIIKIQDVEFVDTKHFRLVDGLVIINLV